MSESKLNLKIIVSCHKPAKLILNDYFLPIQLGAVRAKTKLKGMIQDDKGDNISDLNPMYCEMTAQYYAWKNMDLDYYGFCHYRRYFSFAKKKYIEDEYGNILESYPNDSLTGKYAIDEESIRTLVEKNDMVISERKDLQKLAEPASTVREHYGKASHLHIEDFDMMLKIVDEKYPEYSEVAHRFAKGHVMCFCNMYILKKELFFKYA